jgi:hypothetical protein
MINKENPVRKHNPLTKYIWMNKPHFNNSVNLHKTISTHNGLLQTTYDGLRAAHNEGSHSLGCITLHLSPISPDPIHTQQVYSFLPIPLALLGEAQ